MAPELCPRCGRPRGGDLRDEGLLELHLIWLERAVAGLVDAGVIDGAELHRRVDEKLGRWDALVVRKGVGKAAEDSRRRAQQAGASDVSEPPGPSRRFSPSETPAGEVDARETAYDALAEALTASVFITTP